MAKGTVALVELTCGHWKRTTLRVGWCWCPECVASSYFTNNVKVEGSDETTD
jgi:hypothetical protein